MCFYVNLLRSVEVSFAPPTVSWSGWLASLRYPSHLFWLGPRQVRRNHLKQRNLLVGLKFYRWCFWLLSSSYRWLVRLGECFRSTFSCLLSGSDCAWWPSIQVCRSLWRGWKSGRSSFSVRMSNEPICCWLPGCSGTFSATFTAPRVVTHSRPS